MEALRRLTACQQQGAAAHTAELARMAGAVRMVELAEVLAEAEASLVTVIPVGAEAQMVA